MNGAKQNDYDFTLLTRVYDGRVEIFGKKTFIMFGYEETNIVLKSPDIKINLEDECNRAVLINLLDDFINKGGLKND